jgi:tetratricopeptide (TPR) repeat protein
MRCLSVVLMVVVVAASRHAVAQVSVDEAQRRLIEREAHRAAQSRPASAPSASADPVASDVSMEQALHEAWDQLLSKQYAEAAARFTQVIARQPRNVSALEGRGICSYELSRYKLAVEDADKAFGFARNNPKVVRQAALAAGVANMRANLPLRAVRIALEALKSEDKASVLDEEMQNVLGTAIWRCKADMRGLPLVREAGKYYMNYDEKLARARNSRSPRYFGFEVQNVDEKNGLMRRWGTQWLPSEEANAKWVTYAAAVASRDAAINSLATAVQNRQKAERACAGMYDLSEKHSMFDINRANLDLQSKTIAEASAGDALKSADSVLQGTEGPQFPLKVEPVWAEPGAAPQTQPGSSGPANATTVPATHG